MPKATLNCTTNTFSNWAVTEEIKRLTEIQTVVEVEPEYTFHKDDCKYDGTTFLPKNPIFTKEGKVKVIHKNINARNVKNTPMCYRLKENQLPIIKNETIYFLSFSS